MTAWSIERASDALGIYEAPLLIKYEVGDLGLRQGGGGAGRKTGKKANK